MNGNKVLNTMETKRKMSENNARYWEGKTRSEETKRKLSVFMKSENNPNRKNHGTIHKKGKNNYGKQVYALRFKGKTLKRSIDKQKLIEFFLKNYPLEILEV